MASEHKTSRRNFLTAATAALGVVALSPLSRAFAEPTTQPATDPFEAQAPTTDRPYYYIRYDEKTKAADPKRIPTEVALHKINGPSHDDKIIVMNYLAENSKYSTMQTELLQNTIKKLAAQSKKPFLLVDVVAYDKDGKGIYHAETAAALQSNSLGKDGQTLKVDPTKDLIPPYGIIYGESLEKDKQGRVQQLSDFALLNAAGTPVTSDALLQANVRSIVTRLVVTVKGYNSRGASKTKFLPMH